MTPKFSSGFPNYLPRALDLATGSQKPLRAVLDVSSAAWYNQFDSLKRISQRLVPSPVTYDIHRIGGGSVENLRLKLKESQLSPPGISVLKAATPVDAAQLIRAAFPKARKLHEAAKTIGSTSGELIRGAGFDIIHANGHTVGSTRR